MRKLSVLVVVALILGGTVVVGGTAHATGLCVGAPVGTVPVYVDTNNDGNPEFYLGSIHDPSVCFDATYYGGTYLPSAGTCGTGCVQLKVTVLPTYPNARGYVSVNYGYDGGTESVAIPFDTGIGYEGGQTICIKVGGSGVC